MWEEVKSLKKNEVAQFVAQYKKKSKFLVDENLGIGTCEVLQELGWNAKFVSDVNLVGKSDKDVYQYAFKHGRIILTHDDDFLNHKQFPFYCNPGVIILPGGDGNEAVLERAIADMLTIVGPFGEIHQGAKIIFYPTREFKIIALHEDGYIKISRFKFVNGSIYEDIDTGKAN